MNPDNTRWEAWPGSVHANGDQTRIRNRLCEQDCADHRRSASSGHRLGAEKEAVISGKILSDTKTPISGARVSVYGRSFADRIQQIYMVASSIINEMGEYKAGGLRAGTYFIMAPAGSFALSPAGPARKPEDSEYRAVPTYFPNAVTFRAAAPVNVSPAETRGGVDIVVQRAFTYCAQFTGDHPVGDSGKQMILL